MSDQSQSVLDSFGGVASRAQLLMAIGRHSLDNEVKRGELVALFPRAYSRPWDADVPHIRLRAALASVGGEIALSHLTALQRWGLPAPAAPVHVTAFQPRHPRGVPGELVVHRTLLPLRAVSLDGLPVVRAELAVITSWPLLDGSDQRAPLIEATRRRLLSPATLTRAAERMWWVGGITELRLLVGLIAAGCESELELWGYTDVFNVAGLQDGVRQRIVRVGGREFRLDLAYEDEMLAVELDGRAYHAGKDQWERDIARDLALATAGWQTIRFSHRRLTGDIAGCRRDTLAVRAARRQRIAS
jgi:very-short-patch-repair endonuclease